MQSLSPHMATRYWSRAVIWPSTPKILYKRRDKSPLLWTDYPGSFWIFAWDSHPHPPTLCPVNLEEQAQSWGWTCTLIRTQLTLSRFALFSLLGTDRLCPFFLCFITTFLIQNSMVKSALPSFAYIKKGDPQTWETFFSLHKV